MKVYCFGMGPLDANMYIVGVEDSFFVIDPCVKCDVIKGIVDNNRLEDFMVFDDNIGKSEFSFSKISAVIATHTHFDHICFVDEWTQYSNKTVYIANEDKEGLTDAKVNSSDEMGFSLTFKSEGEDINKLSSDTGIDFDIVFTPGHTMGSVCIGVGSVLFTGDMLFAGSIGRTDLPGGDSKLMRSSIQKLKDYSKSHNRKTVFPGHGASTLLDDEVVFNVFFR